MSKGIRRYGPGKFNTILDSVIYGMCGEGMGDESCGDVSEVGFAAEKISFGDGSIKEAERIVNDFGKGPLTDEERKMIEDSVGAIMVEGEQGFVTVDYYDNEEELEKDWEEIEEDASSDAEEDEEDEDEEEEEEAETESAQEEGE